MKYIQITLMGLAIGAAPIASIANDLWILGMLLNCGVFAVAMWATFTPEVSNNKESQLFAILLWGSLFVQSAWAIVA